MTTHEQVIDLLSVEDSSRLDYGDPSMADGINRIMRAFCAVIDRLEMRIEKLENRTSGADDAEGSKDAEPGEANLAEHRALVDKHSRKGG